MESGFKVGLIVATLIVLLCCGLGTMMLTQVTGQIDARANQARRDGNRFVTEVLKDFDAKRLVSLSTKEYAEAFDVKEFQETLNGNRKALGNYVSGEGRATIRHVSANDRNSVVVAEYVQSAKFERGRARVRMNLEYRDKAWRISLFAIEPDDGKSTSERSSP
jgi:hypothetical protein